MFFHHTRLVIPLKQPINIKKRIHFHTKHWIIENAAHADIKEDALAEWCLTYDMYAFTLCILFFLVHWILKTVFTKNTHHYKLKTMFKWRTLFRCDIADNVHFTVISFKTLPASLTFYFMHVWHGIKTKSA